MIPLKPAGFFRDLPYGQPEAPALTDSVRSEPAPDELRAVAYLRAGALLAVSPMPVHDLLDPQAVLGGARILTDGVWMWPWELAHYVEKYHCALPDDFVEHMRARGWKPPPAGEIDFETILKDVKSETEDKGDER